MSRRRPPRSLRPEEQDLWRSVALTARPLHVSPPGPAPAEPPRAEPVNVTTTPPEVAAPLPHFRIGVLRGTTASVTTDRAPGPAERLATAPLRMDAKAHRRLVRGKLAPEDRLDLHGLTLAEAQPRLARFLLGAHASGLRLVLVITGKGRGDDGRGPIPQRAGALRHEVPVWLSRPPLAALVQQVVPAHQRHGGGGAFYVWLRRARD
jgi:DNA-nicking Smr family endonuclease